MNRLSIGWFISPHGYGHAARSCAIMNALSEQQPKIQFEIFTTIPEHFFSSALQAQYRYHSAQTDIGFVQQSPTVLDLDKTLSQLNDFMPFAPERVDQLATTLTQSKCPDARILVASTKTQNNRIWRYSLYYCCNANFITCC